MDAMEAILTRRSTRRMSAELPSDELIGKVVEAGRTAPSGSNSQTTHFLVITKKEVLDDLERLVQEAFAGMEDGEGLYVSMRNSILAAKRGNYAFHYHAPVLIVTANKKGYSNAMADSACALENMMIAANALDLGSCWINQLHWLTDHGKVRDYMLELGLGEDETITGGLILGFGTGGKPVRTPLKRKGNPVTWIKD